MKPSSEIGGADQHITHGGRSSDSWFCHNSEAGGVEEKKHEGGFIIQSRQKKTTRNAGERGMEELENVRHSSMSHGTWAVGAWLAASRGRLRSAHVTLFMNGAGWRREDAAQKRQKGGMQRRWSLLHWLRGGAKRDQEEGGFQRRSSQRQQVRLLWRL